MTSPSTPDSRLPDAALRLVAEAIADELWAEITDGRGKLQCTNSHEGLDRRGDHGGPLESGTPLQHREPTATEAGDENTDVRKQV